ncbi:hypothetical protein HZA86_05430 [Candidatus Uhrbacteria bacterium]|nr:hypothetical protein [Candidatus Uhrbacteria bacterium]
MPRPPKGCKQDHSSGWWLLNFDSDPVFRGRIDTFGHLAMGGMDYNRKDSADVALAIADGRLKSATLCFIPVELGEADLGRLLAEAKVQGSANRCVITYFAADRDKEHAEFWAGKFGSVALHKNMESTEPSAEAFFKAASKQREKAALQGGMGCTI